MVIFPEPHPPFPHIPPTGKFPAWLRMLIKILIASELAHSIAQAIAILLRHGECKHPWESHSGL